MLKIKKLTPYFRGLSGKSRLMIYLLATGKFSFDEVRKLTVADLTKLSDEIPSTLELFDICEELEYGRAGDEYAFHCGSRSLYSVNEVMAILKRSHNIADAKYGGLKNFVKIVNSSRKK